MAGSLQTGDRRVRPRLGSRHGTPLASRGVPGERGLLSSCIWNLGVFSGRCTGESLPLHVDFIHRVVFGEVSGHRVLLKRGPGNRGPTECGTTHEATSGRSEEHTSELQSPLNLVCRLLLEKKKKKRREKKKRKRRKVREGKEKRKQQE